MTSITLVAVFALLLVQARGATYYVSTTGNDSTGDGSAGNPWATIDHADLQSLIGPGDTVIVQPGTYPQSTGAGIALQNIGGTEGAPVTYLANGKVTIDQSGFVGETFGIQVQSPYIIISGFEIVGAAHGIVLDGSLIWTGHNCVVTNCVIRDSAPVNSSGVYLNACQNGTVVRNVIYNINSGGDAPWGTLGAGIRMRAGGTNSVWNNTIDNAYLGVFFYGTSLGGDGYGYISTLNNIVINSRGWAFVNPWTTDPSYFDSGYNLVRVVAGAVTYGNYPAGNNGPLPTDITAEPMFVFPVNHDYRLLAASPALEVGTNVGFAFLGTAPDIGAFEGPTAPAQIGTVAGKVSANAAGTPGIAGATVQTINGAFSTTTDANGDYQLIVPAGLNDIKASGAFLSTQTLPANVSAGEITTLNLTLSLTNTPKTYYVSHSTGNDGNPGTVAQPWKTIGNGDDKSLVNPGDIVMVSAATYPQTTTNGVNLAARSGYSFAPITYQAQGAVLIDQSSASGGGYGFKVGAKAIVLRGFEIKGSQHGIYLAPGSEFCTVDSCIIHDANGTVGDASGIYVHQSVAPTLSRNTIYNISAAGDTTWSPAGAAIRLQGGSSIKVLNNTIDNAYLGIYCHAGSGPGAGPSGIITTENNIVVNCPGWAFVNPWGSDLSRFVSGYNLVFNDTTTFGNFPAGNNGPLGSDLAGDPGFVNAAGHNYQLGGSSLARNMGLNVGLPFTGIAPDLGAYESTYNPPIATYYVDDATGNDGNDGTLAQPWKTISNGHATGRVNPGDTVVVKAGTYPQSPSGLNLATRHGVPDALITYKADGNVLIDQTAAGVSSYGVTLGAGIKLEGFEIKGAQVGVYVMPGADSTTVDSCIIHDSNPAGSDASGVFVSKSTDVKVIRNVIYKINAGNTPWSPVGTAVEDQYSRNLSVLNNTIDSCYLGVFYYGGTGKGGGPYARITTKNNIVANCTGWGFVNPWLQDSSFFDCGYNLIFNAVVTYGNFPANNDGPFPSDVTADPLFINASAGDYRLQSASPAIAKGIDVGLPFSGMAPTLGALEPSLLTLTKVGPAWNITWLGSGTLQSTTNLVSGDWVDLLGATSPYPIPLTGTRAFYRLKN